MTKKNVLIADDDPQLVDVLAIRVSRLGLEVRTARDAVTALNKVQERVPDLIILDVNMPAGNGLSACEMLATDPRSNKIPVIILTGRQDPETIRRCHDMLAYYVLKCPDVWRRIEPLIYELVDIDPPREAHSPTIADNLDVTRKEPRAT